MHTRSAMNHNERNTTEEASEERKGTVELDFNDVVLASHDHLNWERQKE